MDKNKMQAMVFRDIGILEEAMLPIPPCPNGGLLVKVMACGICGGDVRNFSNGLKGGIKNQIMGHEIAGVVVECGGSLEKFKLGDHVALAPDISCGECWYCKRGLVNLCQNHRMLGTHLPGGFAEYLAVPRDVLQRGFIEKIPENMPYEHAAFAETAAAVVACQERVQLGLGSRVLIIGDGPVGCLHVEVARARGASLIMLAGADKLELAKEFGPHLLLDNRDPINASKAVLEATDSIGADIVICAVPSVAVQQQALELCRKRGTLVIYGGVPKNNSMTSLDSNLIHYSEINLTGAFSYPATGLYDALWAINNKQINPNKYITEILPLSKLQEGMELIRTGKALKVIVKADKLF